MMFSEYMRSRSREKDKRSAAREAEIEKEQLAAYDNQKLLASLDGNTERIKQELGESGDIIFRSLELSGAYHVKVAVIFVQGLVDDMRLNEFVIEALQSEPLHHDPEAEAKLTIADMKNRLLSTGNVEEICTWKEFYRSIFLGQAVVLVDGMEIALTTNCIGGMKRGVEEPKSDMLIRGPREGFVESIRINTSMIRRKIRSPKLWLEEKTIGRLSQTPVGIMYIKGLADENVLTDLRNRLDAIDIDGILESGYIEELISDQKWTPFPTIMSNERPDAVAADLLEGRVAILVDGTPFVLVVPSTLNMFFQSAEDYYQRFDVATFLRLLRFLSFILALMMPSIYVAIVGYHHEMIPTQILLKLAAQREGVPFPAYLEAFIMEFVFEILREAVVRMPSAAGNTISIVGALVIGQSVVEAGFVSPAVVIVVSFTAIASFVSPAYNLGIAARLLRFILLGASSTLGFYGISLIVLLLLLHLTNLRSFGVPYLKPFAPMFGRDWKDTLVRAPLWMMTKRPKWLAQDNERRQDMNPKELEGQEPLQ